MWGQAKLRKFRARSKLSIKKPARLDSLDGFGRQRLKGFFAEEVKPNPGVDSDRRKL
jgi:hypothetical protein